MDHATVTIDRAYFETLVRRAEPHGISDDLVTITQPQYEELLRMTREYTQLRNALYRGGIASETLEVLINGNEGFDKTPTYNNNNTAYGEAIQPPVNNTNHAPFTFASTQPQIAVHLKEKADDPQGFHPKPSGSGKFPPPYTRDSSFDHDDASFPSDEKDGIMYGFTPVPRSERQCPSKNERRTLGFKWLPDRTTHKDIVEVVSGGALLDVFLRPREKMASVSFVEGAAAQEFLIYAKRHDIYIRGKRIEVTWNDRQFVLHNHVAHKIAIGATRNIVVHHVSPTITTDSIREDLDHIHNLIVVDTRFENGGAYISLNSVQSSLFAHMCMRSRLKFKGMQIEWYPDECARPLPQVVHPQKKENIPAPVKKLNPMANRFQLLTMDGTEDGDEDGDETSYTSMGLNHSWADTSIAV